MLAAEPQLGSAHVVRGRQYLGHTKGGVNARSHGNELAQHNIWMVLPLRPDAVKESPMHVARALDLNSIPSKPPLVTPWCAPCASP